jgi:adenosylcobinamide-GDP ribazoletransferase
MKRLITAIQFLTVLPVGRGPGPAPEDLSRSMALFPVVGALQGGLLVAIDIALSLALPRSVVTAVVLLALVLTNGGLHLDGFADTVDGLAGGKTPEDRLRIMRDSSTGAVGAALLSLLILIKYLALRDVPDGAREAVVLLFPMAGRWSMVPMARFSGYARSTGGVGAAFAGNTSSTLVKATLIAAGLIGVALGFRSIALLVPIGAAAWLASAFFKRKLGGVTGDVFGFQSEVGEALFILLALWDPKLPPFMG